MVNTNYCKKLILCSGNLGIVKILHYLRSDMYDVHFWQEDGPLANGALCLSTHKHNGKSGTDLAHVRDSHLRRMSVIE